MVGCLAVSLLAQAQGTVTGWGDQAQGQAIPPPGLTGVIAIAAGDNHSLALEADGTIRGWGDNSFDEITIPASVPLATHISAGTNFSVAILPDGTVQAWGQDLFGSTEVPSGLDNVIAIACSAYHTVALKADGTVVQWGDTFAGTPPSGLDNVIQVSTSHNTCAALKADGTVVEWGTDNGMPSSIADVTQIAIDDNGGAALLSNGFVEGWGLDDTSQLVPNAISVAAAGNTVTVLKADGTVTAWGQNNFGQATVPSTLSGVVAIAAGQDDALALRADGTQILGWGSTDGNYVPVPSTIRGVKDLSLNENAEFLLPITSAGTVLSPWYSDPLGYLEVPDGVTNVVETTNNDFTSFALHANGTVERLSYREVAAVHSYVQEVPPGLSRVKQVAANTIEPEVYALLDDGTVTAFQGPGVPLDIPLPDGLSNIKQLCACGSAVVALKADGTVVAWGLNFNHVLEVPTGLNNVVSISSLGAVDALKADGTVVQWGDNGTFSVPDGLNGIKAIGASGTFAYGLKADGTLTYWGSDQIDLPGSQATETPAGLNDVCQVNVSYQDTFALRAFVNHSPIVLNIPSNLTLEENGPTTTASFADASATDPDGQNLTYQWTLNGNVVSTDLNPSFNLVNGLYTVVFTATDPDGAVTTQSVRLLIQDTTPPSITGASATPNSLWPPNHGMVLITVPYSATDNSGTVTTSLTATSSEADSGLGKEDVPGDIQIVDAHHLYVRAERFSTNGRNYTVTIHAIDPSGNKSSMNVTVNVPYSQKS